MPYLLLEHNQKDGNDFQHVGSIDSDWIVDVEDASDERYQTIVELLAERGYSQDPVTRHRFSKEFLLANSVQPLTLSVDLLTKSPRETRSSARRHRRIQPDLEARRLETAEFALSHFGDVTLQGYLLGGGFISVEVQMVDIVGSIATKGYALGRRYSEKDAYDLYALIANYGGGPIDVANSLRPFLEDHILKASLQKIRSWWNSLNGAGPIAVANFFNNEEGEARSRRIRDAFETVNRLLNELQL